MVFGKGDENSDEKESLSALFHRYAFKPALCIRDHAVLVAENIITPQDVGG